MTETQLSIARRLLALGLSVFPVPRPRPGVSKNMPGDGKTPILKWGEYQTRLPTPLEMDAWFGGEPVNLAVITGAVSGLVVVDADSCAAVREVTTRLPRTPWQVQSARGFHLYYRHPGVHVSNRGRIDTRDDVQVKGDRGYVITFGSIHASGAAYLEAGDWREPRESVPVFWPGWLARRPKPPGGTGKLLRVPTGDVVDRARAYLAAIPRPEIGHGSDTATLYAACRIVRGFNLSTTDAEALLWEWAGGRPGWTREWVARKVKHAELYGTETIGALR